MTKKINVFKSNFRKLIGLVGLGALAYYLLEKEKWATQVSNLFTPLNR